MGALSIHSPNEAIFVSNFGKNNKPLFKSQIELATEISKVDGYNDKNQATIRSTISQIFTGERNVSKNLRYALFKVIESRFDKKKYDFKEFQSILLTAFKINYEERLAIKQSKNTDIDYINLIKDTKSATELLISTLEPAELHKSPLADQLKDELLQKVGIFESVDSSIVPATYCFFLPKNESYVARDFWEKLRAYILSENNKYNEDTINKELLKLNSNGILKTYLTDSKYTLVPSVFLNYSTPKISGYCVSYIVDTPSVAALSNKVVHTWKDNVYPELEKLKENNEYHFKNLL